jgi:serine/threonine-protein kinase
MAVVYLAEDLKHHRKVAVKVFAPELAAELGADRFLREITVTAQLNHPHILPLLDSGDVDGLLYYVTPFVEGESLRERLDREGQLPVEDVVQIAQDVAAALTHAHSRGVIHRDIKPENVLLSAGEAVVADFGIARAVVEAGGGQLTKTGLAVGTPAYMSPEQLAGEQRLDGRADLYALGCLVFEMLTAQAPFRGPTLESVVHQHLTVDAPPVTNVRHAVPPNIAATVAKALAKTPADRFATAVQFAEALGPSLATAGVPLPPLHERKRVRGRVAALAGSAVLILGLAGVLLRLSPTDSVAPLSNRPRLLVLPFENLGASTDEYFADGITEEMTSRLAEISGLGVISRTSALRFKGVDRTLQEIGAEVGAQYVLEGTVRTDRLSDGTGQVRVTPQLIRVSDDTHIWTDRYTASLAPGEVFRVQADIAEAVAGALNLTLLEPERRAISATPTGSAEAHHHYLLGRFHWNKRTGNDLELAVEHFGRAIEQDSRYALAHAGLADAYVLFPFYGVRSLSRQEAYSRAERAARQAIRLDSTLAEARTSLAYAIMYERWDWAAAEREFQRALVLDPDYTIANYWYCEYLLVLGRLDEAIVYGERAVALDPVSTSARSLAGIALLAARRYDEAVVQLNKAIELNPAHTISYFNLAMVHLERQQWDAAAAALKRATFPDELAVSLPAALADTSRRREAARLLAGFEQDRPAFEVSLRGGLYAMIGFTDTALARLEESYGAHSLELLLVESWPMFDSLRSDRRFQDLLRRMRSPR